MPLEPAEHRVTVRYWAGARAAAGVDHDTWDMRDTRDTGTWKARLRSPDTRSHASVQDVLDRAVAAHTGLGPVLGVASVLLDGRSAARSEPVPAGTTLEILPPFAGG